jgi:NHLM bacteriocin system ABC transporter ATP-binding protein
MSVRLAANAPLRVEPGSAWRVETGSAQAFAVDAAGRRKSIGRCAAGSVVVGAASALAVGLVLVGLEDDTLAERTEIVDIPEARLVQWLEVLAQAVSLPPPADSVALVAGESLEPAVGATVRSAHGLIWVEGTSLSPFGTPVAASRLPLPSHAWASVLEPGAVHARAATDGAGDAAQLFVSAVLAQLSEEIEREGDALLDRISRRSEFEQALVERSYARLSSVVGGRPAHAVGDAEGEALRAAFAVVASELGVEAVPARRKGGDPVEELARAAGMRVRKVVLAGDWWKSDAGPLLAHDRAGKPVALLPRGRGYELVDPLDGSRARVDAHAAAELDSLAAMLYPPLPPGPIWHRDVIRFAFRHGRADLSRVLVLGVGIGALSLLTPLLTRTIFSQVVPGLDRGRLVWLTMLLAVFAAVVFGLGLVQRLSVLRLEGRSAALLQAAMFDRVLDLPLPFFRNRSRGTLVVRVLGIERMRPVAAGALVTVSTALPVAVFNLGLAFYLEPRLALFASPALIVVAVAAVLLVRQQVPRQTLALERNPPLFNRGLELVGAISKLRAANAERRAFAYWSVALHASKRAAYQAQRASAALVALAAGAPALAVTLMLAGAATLPPDSVSPARFIAFNTAYLQALVAVGALTGTAIALVQVLPYYLFGRQVLAASRETDAVRRDPGPLRGEIEVSHVSLRYDAEGPLALDDVSFHVGAGELVAIVGPSGAGKSSILRLLLGFERPQLGSVRFDGHDLETLDPRAVRRQIGVVQSARLLPGDIFGNIVGARPLSLDDAWAAARLAGIDQEIERLPMGMHTLVTEGTATFSGGQQQRLALARALVGRPRLLFLDEATSALDNRTQAEVAAAVDRLQATRLVIAHRLSTVRRADRILVVDEGRLVQQGTYDELMASDGLFRELAARQLV